MLQTLKILNISLSHGECGALIVKSLYHMRIKFLLYCGLHFVIVVDVFRCVSDPRKAIVIAEWENSG